MINSKTLSVAVFSALISRLCCIVPFLAIVSGMSGGATLFSFIEPFRPVLLAISVSILGFGFYQAYKPAKMDQLKPCCRVNAARKQKRNRLLLGSSAGLTTILFFFPYYSGFFISKNTAVSKDQQNLQMVHLIVKGMSCQGCANNISLSLTEIPGVISDTIDFKEASARISIDQEKINSDCLIERINKLGFTAVLISSSDVGQ